jgi:hypothetical protein
MAEKVKVTFVYVPEEPDPGDSTGMTEDEYNRLIDQLMQLGAEDTTIERVAA